MRNRVVVMLLLLAGTIGARASPFWVTWEEGWPEDQGWNHGTTGPPAQRWLEDGLLFVDTRSQYGIRDQYYQHPPTLILEPGEVFTLVWRARVDESTPASDPGVLVEADDHFTVFFNLDTQSIHSVYEPGKSAPFSPHEFHEFRVESSDMRVYDLYIDGEPALHGDFFESLFPGPSIVWGTFSGCETLTAWDRLAYGIVPEPTALSWISVLFLCARSLSRSATSDFGFSHDGSKK